MNGELGLGLCFTSSRTALGSVFGNIRTVLVRAGRRFLSSSLIQNPRYLIVARYINEYHGGAYHPR